ncbi:EAL domain-containing protein [Peteryoungia desertarenae]|uniref:EAL domain-containing protein n=1 Tax=Peteryoungia desertarenae TaxID=1813451 RepID=A0ABX6QNE3_9HYPH|nr:GGDEF domain-containing protein [Peteryoungia desertarenae]QLF69750.1 EAL domain-containing protein [Peteryoungia desertarenae]
MLTKLQNTILEMIATGQPVVDTIEELCRRLEAVVPDLVCSILRVEADGRLRHLAGPSLPQHYINAIDGTMSGPGVGSCGTAAHSGKQVIVTDIETHPFWQDYKHLALAIGLKACWSTPIMGSGRVLGTFAFYYRVPRGPSAFEKRAVSTCVQLCAIALERDIRIDERRRLAEIDQLTQLPNRSQFERALKAQADSGRHWGLILGDLDNLKLVNDTFGHHVGDEMIRAVAARLAGVAEPGMAFRLGGDEFAVIVSSCETTPLDTVAARLLEAIPHEAECGSNSIYPSMTLGGADSRSAKTVTQIRQNADYALYHAKDHARGRYIPFVHGLGTAIVNRFRSIREVTDALREDRMEAHYQPIFELGTYRIRGWEALCRMRNRSGEIVPAGQFQEAMKDAHVALGITDYMIKTAARDMRHWIDLGLNPGRISVNFATADFRRGSLTDRICQTFAAHGIQPSQIVVEVTEDVYLDARDQVVYDQLKAMRAKGIAIALDDFGTGYASLTHLLDVPVDFLKIDKAFIRRIMDNRDGTVITKCLLDIAEGLGIDVVAEGIETAEQAACLAKLGCGAGQGWFFSKAIDRDSATQLLRAQSAITSPVEAQRQRSTG